MYKSVTCRSFKNKPCGYNKIFTKFSKNLELKKKFIIVMKLQLDAKYLSYKKLIAYISKHIYNSRTVFFKFVILWLHFLIFNLSLN